MKRLLIVTDAWHPQVNGVVRSLDAMGSELSARGYVVHYLTPQPFWTMPMPTYPEIRLSIATQGRVAAHIEGFGPDHIHIATEGPLGFLARRICVAKGMRFTTSYHTRFPEYVAARLPVPTQLSYGYLNWFHSAANATMVPTPGALDDLAQRDFRNLRLWSRGVDLSRFSPGPATEFRGLPKPYMICVGRVAVEKNVEAFLKLDLPGTKIVVGDGPQRDALEREYPQAVFVGKLSGAALTAAYRSADVMVFPSRTDTFGNVMIEALACGTPVAAYPVMGPVDVLTDQASGAMDSDLEAAVLRALTLSRDAAARYAQNFTWAASADQFEANLVSIRPSLAAAA